MSKRTNEERLRILKVRQLILDSIVDALEGKPLPLLLELDDEIEEALFGEI